MNPEAHLCPVIIPARRQQEHGCEEGTAECAFPAHIEQKEPSSVPFHVEKGLDSSFVFTATAAVSPGNNGNIYQNKESSCAKLRKPLGWLFYWKGRLCTVCSWTQRIRWQLDS